MMSATAAQMLQAAHDPWSSPRDASLTYAAASNATVHQGALSHDPVEEFSDDHAPLEAASPADVRRAKCASRSRSDSRRRLSGFRRTRVIDDMNVPQTPAPVVRLLPSVQLPAPHLLLENQFIFLQSIIQQQKRCIRDLQLELETLRRVTAEQRVIASHRLDQVERQMLLCPGGS